MSNTDQSVQTNPFRQRGNFYWRGLTVLSVVALLLLLALTLGIPARLLGAPVVIWLALLAVYLWLYGGAVRKGGASYDKRPAWAATLKINPKKFDVPFSHLGRILSFLIDVPNTRIREDQIVRGTRRHWVDLVRRIWLPLVGAFVCLMGAVIFFALKHSGDYIVKSPGPAPKDGRPRSNLLVLHWWSPIEIFMIACLVLLVSAWVRSWKWSYRDTLITNKRVLILTIPQKWQLPLLQKNLEAVDLVRIIFVRNSKDGIGNNLDQGKVGLDTESTIDVDFNVLWYMPHPEEMADDLNNARLLEIYATFGSPQDAAIKTQLPFREHPETDEDWPTSPIPVVREGQPGTYKGKSRRS